ncbi:hypothetical protein RJG79_00305 [Mycoplasmatota bacterium WC44]
MNNKLRQFFKMNALAFTILYLAIIVLELLINFGLLSTISSVSHIILSVRIFEFLTFGLFFILLTIEAYNLNSKNSKIFAVLFLLFFGILLFVNLSIISTQFLMLNIIFLIIYSYYRSNGSRLDIPLSYIAVGHFLQVIRLPIPFMHLIAYLVLFYGWVKYLKECRYRFDTF